MPTPPKTDRNKKLVALRKKGVSFRDIAKVFGFSSVSTAYKIWKRAQKGKNIGSV